MNDLVSIIIPVYNTETTLERCLNSILGQTYSHIEVIIIDDGSEDNSYSLCNKYASLDNRVFVYHENNQGVSHARNQGLIHANGRYITFVDSDDYVKEDLIESLLGEMHLYNADLIVSALSDRNDENGFYININRENIEQIMFLINNHLIFGPTQKLYKSELIKGIYFPENYKYGEDLLFNLEYLKKAQTICYVDRQLYFYCRRDESLSTVTRWDMYENDMSLNIKLQEWFEEKDLWNPETEMYIDNRILDTIINSICLMFRTDCKMSIKETRNYYKKITHDEICERALKANVQMYPKWQIFLVKHKLTNLLTAIAMIKRRR